MRVVKAQQQSKIYYWTANFAGIAFGEKKTVDTLLCTINPFI